VGEGGKLSLLLNSKVIGYGVYKIDTDTEWVYPSALSGTSQQNEINSVV
jgi:hypothetical protein